MDLWTIVFHFFFIKFLHLKTEHIKDRCCFFCTSPEKIPVFVSSLYRKTLSSVYENNVQHPQYSVHGSINALKKPSIWREKWSNVIFNLYSILLLFDQYHYGRPTKLLEGNVLVMCMCQSVHRRSPCDHWLWYHWSIICHVGHPYPHGTHPPLPTWGSSIQGSPTLSLTTQRPPRSSSGSQVCSNLFNLNLTMAPTPVISF